MAEERIASAVSVGAPDGASAAARVAFNPFSPEFREDPYSTYAALREREPVKRIMGSWVLSRHADILGVLRDRRFSSSRIPSLVKRRARERSGGTSFEGYRGVESFIDKAIVFTENPDHTRLRRLVNPIFNQAAIERERRRIAQISDELIEELIGFGEIDVIGGFADKLPMYLMCDRMGAPRDMGPALRDWAHDVRFLLDPTLMSERDFSRVEARLQEALDYLHGLIDARRVRPSDDIVTELLASRTKSDRLTDAEIALTCIMSFVAGHETTKHLIGNGVLALLSHPSEAEKLRANPGLADNTVEEVLRFEAPLQQTKRIAVEAVSIADKEIGENEQVLLLLGSANRDPDVFESPDTFDIARSSASGHLSFGYGMRACLGGALAREEAAGALARLFSRDFALRSKDVAPSWQSDSVILRGLEHLAVVVEKT